MNNIYINPPRNTWSKLCQRPVIDNQMLIPQVSGILDCVKQEGDKALRDYARQFDGFVPAQFKVSNEEFAEAIAQVPEKLKLAIQTAAANIERFHSEQQSRMVKTETTPGVICWQKPVALSSVGIYIPGGSAPLFSTVLMLAIPAAIAGCKHVVMCTPAGKDGKVNPAMLYAAKITGVSEVYKVGGAQAIAAMSYGTESIAKVDKLFGPGNQYVTMAKQLVSAEGMAIDMPAGPSEVLVIADSGTPAAFAAADLLSQAEHGTDSQVILLTENEQIIENVQMEIARQLPLLKRRSIAEKALENARFIVFDNRQSMMDFSNAYAPEHLILATADAAVLAEKVVNAGSVFMGMYTPESAGDYASGTNHTLPTNGFARAWSGVNLDSYYKKISFQQISSSGLVNLGETIEVMATAEGLDAHKNAVTQRLAYIRESQQTQLEKSLFETINR